MKDIILETRDLHYRYEDGTHALKGVDLRVRRGERLAVMGANGSGKSTFFLCLNGVLRPQQGAVWFDGSPVDDSPKGLLALRQRVGIVFQDPDNQLFSADVYGEISFGPMNMGLDEAEVHRRVQAVVERLRLGELTEKPVHFLSGGQKKAVAIADILVMQPDVVMLDEPAAALDPPHARMVDALIDQLSSQGVTVIVSTHDARRALLWADEVAVFHQGRVLQKAPPLEVFSDRALLEQTGLERPAVLGLYEALVEQGLLQPLPAPPCSAAQLEACIRQAGAALTLPE